MFYHICIDGGDIGIYLQQSQLPYLVTQYFTKSHVKSTRAKRQAYMQ